MKKTQIIETMTQDLRGVMPDENDFKYITEAYVDYHINDTKCAPDHTPKGIAQNAEFIEGDAGTVVKYMVVAATLGWRKLILRLKPICEAVGWLPGDLKLVIQEIKLAASPLEPLYEKYCEPALEAVRAAWIGESLEKDLVEDIEKHEELNPALFNKDASLKPEVKEKINEIVEEFLKNFEEVNVELTVRDVVLTGSNASYNYTKDSDLDIHIIADTSNIEDTLDLHKVIYDAYKSAFNKKFEIELKKVPVEIYVETQDTPLVSNGIYSVSNDSWIKEPTKEDIPEVDQEAINKAFKPWERRYKALAGSITDETKDESKIDKFIDSLYDLRKKGLSTGGEYSIENLIFKEMRNNGYLDDLKELRHKVIAQRLSLYENLNNIQSLSEYLNLLNNLI